MAKELPITEFDLRTVDESTQMFNDSFSGLSAAKAPFFNNPHE